MRTYNSLIPAVLGTVLLLGGCATRSPGAAPRSATPAPSVEVYFYPAKGQSHEQQQRDRYECYLWARDQSGFDPSLPQLAPGRTGDTRPAPTGDRAAAGAIAGAILGSMTSRGDKTEGAVRGAITGAVLGGMADEAEIREAERRAQLEREQLSQARAKQAAEYRRALSACLEGRGYTVK